MASAVRCPVATALGTLVSTAAAAGSVCRDRDGIQMPPSLLRVLRLPCRASACLAPHALSLIAWIWYSCGSQPFCDGVGGCVLTNSSTMCNDEVCYENAEGVGEYIGPRFCDGFECTAAATVTGCGAYGCQVR